MVTKVLVYSNTTIPQDTLNKITKRDPNYFDLNKICKAVNKPLSWGVGFYSNPDYNGNFRVNELLIYVGGDLHKDKILFSLLANAQKHKLKTYVKVHETGTTHLFKANGQYGVQTFLNSINTIEKEAYTSNMWGEYQKPTYETVEIYDSMFGYPIPTTKITRYFIKDLIFQDKVSHLTIQADYIERIGTNGPSTKIRSTIKLALENNIPVTVELLKNKQYDLKTNKLIKEYSKILELTQEQYLKCPKIKSWDKTQRCYITHETTLEGWINFQLKPHIEEWTPEVIPDKLYFEVDSISKYTLEFVGKYHTAYGLPVNWEDPKDIYTVEQTLVYYMQEPDLDPVGWYQCQCGALRNDTHCPYCGKIYDEAYELHAIDLDTTYKKKLKKLQQKLKNGLDDSQASEIIVYEA